MSDTPRVLRWLITGRVQGVYYRYFTQEAARALGLRGWVRNLPDGSVEAVVAGDPVQIDALKDRLRQGPPMARVDDIAEEVLDPADADIGAGDFEARY